jgi:DNA-binding transcriptional LysR family regulator
VDRLAELEAFVRVIETGSFSAAARQLQMGQPAISKTIALLEERLDVRLIHRSTHGLVLTEAGENFYERARRALDEADEADRAAQGTSHGFSGRLRVSATVTFARLHIMNRLPAFLAAHPSLEIDLILDDQSVDLVEHGIDVALRIGKPASFTPSAEKIGRCKRYVLATPAYFARHGEPSMPAEILLHETIVYSQPASGTSWTFRQATTETSIDVRGRIRVTAAEAFREAVFADLGLAIAPEWLFARELKDGAVRPTLADWKLSEVELWAVFPGGERAGAKARAFTTFVKAILMEEGWLASD